MQDEKHSDHKDDGDKYSFLAKRPEMPPAAECDERGASGLESWVEGTLATAAGIGLGEEILHQRPRSRSTSHPRAERALDLVPRSQSRPSSPEVTRNLDQSPHRRRPSMARSTTESPTAVPLHFRRPPTSPGLPRAVPVAPSPTTGGESPTSPSQTRHRRPNSLEFRNSREIRPLWLVERHGSSKGDLIEPDEVLPSLPSSKTSSRAPSVEDLRSLNDEDAVRSWEPLDLSQSIMERRRPTGLTISTSRANDQGEGDLLGSQQATPTAEDFGASAGPKKQKPTYEFHSPSELLQDPAMYPEIPPTAMETLPSAEGSVVGATDTDVFETPTEEKEALLDRSESAKGVGFAGIVDAAVIAAAKEHSKPIDTENDDSTVLATDKELPVETSLEDSATPAPKIGGFADIVNAAVAAEVVHDKNPAEEDLGEPGTVIEEHTPEELGIEQPVESETPKELAPQSVETPAQPVEPQPTNEPVAEEVAAASSSKKKRKKKGKKGQASVDMPGEPVAALEKQAEVATDEKTPPAEVPEAESQPIEAEAVPTSIERNVAAEPQPEAEIVEAPREIEHETLPAAAAEAIEVEKALQPETESEPATEPEASAPAESEAVITSESTPENPGDATEPQSTMTAAQRRKAKKAAKKKAKSLSVSDSVEGSTEEVPPAASDESPAPPEDKVPEAEAGEVATAVESEKQDVFQDANAPDASVSVEQPTPDVQESPDIVEPAEPTPAEEQPRPVEDMKKANDESPTDPIPELGAREIQPPESAQVELTTEPEPVLGTAQPEEIVEPAAAAEGTAVLEKPTQSDDDLFHEAVAEQPDVFEEQKKVQPEPSTEASTEPVTETAAVEPEPEPEVPMTAAQKKKAKKDKKKRKSVAFEDTTTPSQSAIDSQAEEVSKEVESDQPAPVEAVDVQGALTSGETQPSETEQPPENQFEPLVEDSRELPEPAAEGTKDGSEPSAEDSVSDPQSESAPGEAAESTLDQPEQPAAQPEAEAEAEPEVPMTPAQKKKAKKDKKKKSKQQSLSSVPDEEKPVEPESADTQRAENTETTPEISESVEPVAEASVHVETSEPVAADSSVETSEPTPDGPADVVDAAKETTLASEEPSVDATAPEEKREEAVEAEQQKADEQASAPEADAVPETSFKTSDAPKPQEDPAFSEDKPGSEATPAEPEVPMSAAEKRKAKKAKKKKQQQENVDSVSDETPAAETVSLPEAEATEVSKDVQPVPEAESTTVDDTPAPAAEPEAIEISKEDASEPPGVEPETVPQSETPAEAEVVEPTSDAPPVPAEGVSTEAPQEDASPETQQPKEEKSAQSAVAEALLPTEGAETQLAEPETPAADAEVPMTAAQKKKAKKDKKKKRQSAQWDEQGTPETDAASTEQKDVEQTPGVTPEVSVPEETKASDEAAPAQADKEIQAEATPITEDSPASDHAEKEAPGETSANESAATEGVVEPSADPPTVSDVSVPKSMFHETTVVKAADQDQEPKDAVAPPEEHVAEKLLTDETTSDQLTEEPTTPVETTVESAAAAESTAPTPENAAAEQAEEAEPTTPLSKKDKKKKKKKNKSLVLEEESQPEPVQEELSKLAEPVEPAPSVEPTESAASEKVEPAKTVKVPESATVIEEAQSVEQPFPKETVKDETIPEQPSTEAAGEASQPTEPEVPMTAAQKRKAKKDKKKRKSVAFEDEASAAQTETQPEQEQAPVESVEHKDVPSDQVAPSQELSESSKDAQEVALETAGIDQAEAPSAEVEQTDVAETAKEDTPSDKAANQEAQELQPDPSTPAQAEEQPLQPIEPETPSDDKTDTLEEPSAQTAEATDTAAEAGLSAKERRKLKKKEKKKSKSVDLTEETPSPPQASQDAEASTESQAEASKDVEREAPQVEQPEDLTSADADFPKVEEPEVTEAPTNSEKNDALEAAKPDEPETIDNPEQIAEQETAEPEDLDDKLPVVEAAAEAESPPQETEEKTDQRGQDAEASLSAKERRKLKKKEKKRQSKNLDVDEAAPTDAATESKDAFQKPEQPNPTESDTRELSGPVTASSPAENDGKELQSHDTETPATTVKDLASTDEFLSSQVEQPQIESRSSDYPPPPVLERDFDSGEAKDAQKEADVVPALEQPKVPSMEEEKSLGEVEEVAEKEDQTSVDVETVQEEVKPPEADVPVVVEKEISQPKEEDLAEKEAVIETAAEEVEQPVLSKKQKKKDKMKKQKQEEKMEEEIVVPASEPLAAEEKDQPEAVANTSEANEDQPIVEPEPTIEQQPAPDAEEASAEPSRDIGLDVPVIQASEDMESAKDIDPTEVENVAPEPENVEEAPLSRKMSKKEKKKQRQALLARQAEVEAGSELKEQATPETTEPKATASVYDALTVSASTEQQEDIQPADSLQDDSKETGPLPEAEQPIATEREPTEPVNQPVSEEPEPGAADIAPAPADTTAIVPPAESTESMKQAPSENKPVVDAEPPTITRKMSKKEKKKAAAAAAALAAEEEKPTEPEPALSEATPAPQGTVDVPREQPPLDDTQQAAELEPDVQQEAAEQDRDKTDLATCESAKDVAEELVAEVEQQIEPSAETPKPEEVVEEPVDEKPVDDPIARKLSKKGKRMAKNQPEQEALDASTMQAETPAETATPEPEVAAVTESISPKGLRKIVSEAEPVTHEESTVEEISQPEKLPMAIDETREEESKEIEESEPSVPLGSFAASSSEAKDDQLPTELGDQAAIGSLGMELSPKEREEMKKEIEANLYYVDLEKEAGLETAGETTHPEEPEVALPLSKKLSKKEKRKAKKKGFVEEEAPSLKHGEGSAPETALPVESQEASTPASISMEAESLADHPVQPESMQGRESESETAKEVESTVEAQPALEPQPVTDSTPFVPTSTTDEPEPEPETGLSRKASKKKAKKAKKADQALELELPVDNAADQHESGLASGPEALTKEIADSTTREKKQDDEEWPAIEWEDGHSHKHEPSQDKIPEPEPVTPVPESEAIGEYDESAIPSALQEAKKDLGQAIEEEEETWSAPLSKKDKKKAKKNKRKSEQAALAEVGEPDEEPSHKKIELVHESMPEPPVETPVPAPKEIETEPPARTTTPGGSKIASLFPGLERGGFRRSALDKRSPSLKDSAEEETAADLEANRDIAIPVSEAPLATTEINDSSHLNPELSTEDKGEEAKATTIEHDAPAEISHSQEKSPIDPELPINRERSIAEQFPSPDHAASKERSSMLFGSSPSTRTEEASSPRRLLPSQMDAPQDSSCGLRRTPSVIHGRHQHTPRTWNFEDASIPAQAHSPPRSLFGGPYDEAQSRPRTPLHPIAEQEPGDGTNASTVHGGTTRLDIKPEHVLPRPLTPVRKFTDNAMARETWPTPENEKARSQDDLSKASKFSGESGSPMTQTPEQGMPVLKPSGSKGKLRRTNRSTSSDLRGASKALDSSQPPPNLDLDQLPSSSSYDPVTDKGKRPLRNMSDVYVSG